MDFKEEAIKLGINYDSVMEDKFNTFYEELIRVNEYMNLTAITERDEVYNKHFLDSLTILKAINNSKDKLTLLDVGSGAGFPAIPLAITTTNLDITIIDALSKRIKFLNELIEKLELTNVKALHKRAEEYAKEARESYDITTARAVARLPMLCELCLPLTKVGGFFIAMKAQSAGLELEEAKKAIELLGGKLENVLELKLPNDIGKRAIIIIRKIKETPLKYPRAFGKIKEKPL